MRGAWLSVARQFIAQAKDLLFPPVCCLCQQPTDSTSDITACNACQQACQPEQSEQCQRCAAPVGPFGSAQTACPYCSHDRLDFETTFRLGVYEGTLRQAVLQSKGGEGSPAANTLASLLWQSQGSRITAWKPDVVIPIPPYWAKLPFLRHVVTESMATRLAQHLNIPLELRRLSKIRRTPKQTDVSPTDRRRVQANAFRCRRWTAGGPSVLLVDDVMTTGGTAQAATKAVLAAGAARVAIAVIARGLGEPKAY
jgi:predicted amidophosphoribosyltransferase